jgi:hypothetical protein
MTHSIQCRIAECRDYLDVMQGVIMLNAVRLNVIMVNVIMLNDFLISVVAP